MVPQPPAPPPLGPPGTNLAYYALPAPQRLVDTRPGNPASYSGPGPFAATEVRYYDTNFIVPETARAVTYVPSLYTQFVDAVVSGHTLCCHNGTHVHSDTTVRRNSYIFC